MKLKLLIKPEDNFLCSSSFLWFIVEFVINAIHSPPHPIFNYNVSIPQTENNLPPAYINLNYVLTIFMLFARCYLFIKVVIIHSKWSDPAYEKICHECHTQQDYAFYFKAVFIHHSFFITLSSFFLAIFIFGYSIRSVEMVFMNIANVGLVNTNNDWRFFWNGMWCVIISMATVGYGDFAPISLIGRILTLISCFCGTLMLSLLIAALENLTDFSSEETIAYDTIKHNLDEESLKTSAVSYIQIILR